MKNNQLVSAFKLFFVIVLHLSALGNNISIYKSYIQHVILYYLIYFVNSLYNEFLIFKKIKMF